MPCGAPAEGDQLAAGVLLNDYTSGSPINISAAFVQAMGQEQYWPVAPRNARC